MCTAVGFKYLEGYVFGRTMEIGMTMDHDILYVPKNHKGFIVGLDQSFSTEHAILGTSFVGFEAFGDGINDSGLMATFNLYPGYGTFGKTAKSDKTNLVLSDAFNYLLSQCTNVKEVMEKSKDLYIIESYPDRPEFKSVSSHFYFMDTDGNGVVLEPLDGSLVIHQNPYGVLTNAPQFDWHVTNLKNYINIAPANVQSKDFNGISTHKFGEGSGMLGLPGDFTPPSRFVRAAYFVSNTPRNLDRSNAILQGFRILSQFDIPKGAIVDLEHGHKDETVYTSMMDTHKLSYHIKCQNNPNIVSFSHADFVNNLGSQRVALSKEMKL